MLRRTLPPSMDEPNSSTEEEEGRTVRSREKWRSSEVECSSRLDSCEWERVVGPEEVSFAEGERRVELDARCNKEASS